MLDWLSIGARAWWWAPARCVLCDAACVRVPSSCCQSCSADLEPLEQELDFLDGKRLICGYRYTGLLATRLVDIKFRGAPPGLGALLPAWRAACEARGAALRLDAWVSVAPERSRLQQRGYHLPDLLARHLARGDIRARPGWLRRIDHAAPRSRDGRSVPEFLASPAVRGRRVGLVDDVVTSGATLRSAARTLHAAGADITLYAALANARPEEAA